MPRRPKPRPKPPLRDAREKLSRAAQRVQKTYRRMLRYTYLDAISALIYRGSLREASSHAYTAWRLLLSLLAARLVAPKLLAAAAAGDADSEEVLWWAKTGLSAPPGEIEKIALAVTRELEKSDPEAARDLLKALVLSEKVRLYSHYRMPPESIGYRGEEEYESDLVEFMDILRKLGSKYFKLPLPPP